MRIQLHRRIHDITSIQRPFAGPGSSASPSSPTRDMAGAKGRRRGTVLADLAAEGDRNRVVIPLLHRAAGEAESVIGLPDSSRSRVPAVGRDESVADGTSVASAGGSTRPRAVSHSERLYSMFQRHHEPPPEWFPKPSYRQNFQRDLVGAGLAASGCRATGVFESTIRIWRPPAVSPGVGYLRPRRRMKSTRTQ